MKSRTKLYEDADGNASSTRVISMWVVLMASGLLIASYTFAFYHPTIAVGIIGVSSTAFATITGTTFMFLYKQKVNETNRDFSIHSLTESMSSTVHDKVQDTPVNKPQVYPTD
jgi:hypothetical protein